MADAVTHARFVGTDPASDEVVLMKILQVQLFFILFDPLLFREEELEIPSLPRVRIHFQEHFKRIISSFLKNDLINDHCLGLPVCFTR